MSVLFVVLYAGPFLWDVPDGSRVHYTLVFNTFVFCQVFNELNARKVNNGVDSFFLRVLAFDGCVCADESAWVLFVEVNIFTNLRNSLPFVVIMVATVLMQLLIVSVGGDFVQVTQLSLVQWFSCIAIGSWSLIVGTGVGFASSRASSFIFVGFVLRLVPVPKLPPVAPPELPKKLSITRDDSDEEGESDAGVRLVTDTPTAGDDIRVVREFPSRGVTTTSS